MKPMVTIINNEPTFRWTVATLLERHGFAVSTHERNTAAADTVRRLRAAAVIIEASSGSAITANWIVERLRLDNATRYVPIIVCSPDGKFLHSYGEYLRGRGCIVIGRPYSGDQILEILQTVVSPDAVLAAPVFDGEMLAASS